MSADTIIGIIAAPIRLAVWLSDQPWGPFVGPAIVAFGMIGFGIVIIRGERR